jgi:dTDP-4-amino-4,6-dideoxygalactose transaminase
MPDRELFHSYIDQILDSGWLTNRGQCVRELESKLQEYLGVRNVVLVNNGTVALQLAYRVLGLKGEVITTPFTFIATASSAVWEGLDVVFSDINKDSLNLDCAGVQKKINKRTSAIVPVHVFGNPCEVEAIDILAKQHDLKVIYDAAHAFGVKYKGESILNHGDISILSFHATKLFHTIEGGALIINDDHICEQVRKMINFGLSDSGSIDSLGTNAKMNEFQAAMGLCLLDDMEMAFSRRAKLSSIYDSLLAGSTQKQKWKEDAICNYGYYPVLFTDEKTTKQVQAALNDNNIFPRRYFYPSLNKLDFLSHQVDAPISIDVSRRILCLPLYSELSHEDCRRICNIVLETTGGER